MQELYSLVIFLLMLFSNFAIEVILDFYIFFYWF